MAAAIAREAACLCGILAPGNTRKPGLGVGGGAVWPDCCFKQQRSHMVAWVCGMLLAVACNSLGQLCGGGENFKDTQRSPEVLFENIYGDHGPFHIRNGSTTDYA